MRRVLRQPAEADLHQSELPFERDGRLVGWKIRLCGSSIFASLAPQFMRDGQDISMMNSLLKADMGYAIPAFEVGAGAGAAHAGRAG